MYAAKTTFIVGAGASLELGFPTSAQLKGQISKSTDIRYEHGRRPISGDYQIAEALRGYADHYKGQEVEYNKYLYAGWHITKAMPLAISIDNFVDSQNDKYVTAMAKLGIASCIIDAESKCLEEYTFAGDQNKLNWEFYQKTWIYHLFQTIHEEHRKSDIDKIFSNLKFVIFNYDRSLEFFLAKAVEVYYNLTAADAEKVVSAASFLHPYGQIGKLPWQTTDLPILPFGSGEKQHLLNISKSILTFTEQVADKDELGNLHSSIADADQLIFLGFGFHRPNMKLLTPTRNKDTSRVVATAFGISSSDCGIVERQLKDVCFTNSGGKYDKTGQFVIDNACTCSQLFEKYSKTIIS